MTGYASAALRGREAARATNTTYKLRTIVSYREWTAPADRWRGPHLHAELVADCGHVIESTESPTPWMKRRVGERRRCPRCPADPADPPKPLFRDHCGYGYGTELGDRPCKTLARYIDAAYGLLCRKHHDHLLREGYLAAPAAPFAPCRERQTPVTPAPFVPESSPPRRGHLRAV